MNRIKQLRLENSWSKKDLSTMLKVSRVTLTRYERGAGSIKDNILLKLSKFFGVSIDYILGNSNIKFIGNEEGNVLIYYNKLPRELKIEVLGEIKGFLKGIEYNQRPYEKKMFLKRAI